MLFLGRVHPKKGLDHLLRLMSRLNETAEGRNALSMWTLLVVGPDEAGTVDSLRSDAIELGIADRVEFRSAVYGDAKAELLASADAFVLPSRSEGLPMSVLEAWSAGLPVLMTRECNLPRGFTAGAAVELPATERGLEVLRDFMRLERAGLDAIGAKGRQLVLEEFSWRRIAQDFQAVYRWLAGKTTVTPSCVRRGVGTHRNNLQE